MRRGTVPKPVEVYVQLLGEGTTVFRPTKALRIRADVVQLLATDDYDPEDEDWEFKPGSIVRIEKHKLSDGKYYVAVSAAR